MGLPSAYDTLIDESRRKIYDETGNSDFGKKKKQEKNFDDDIFQQFKAGFE